MRIYSLILLALLLLLSSCGMMQTIAVGTTGSVLYSASNEAERENNWDNFASAILGNLKFVEGLLYLDPDNEELLVSAIKGYAGYGFAINETRYLKDQLAENDKVENLNEALYNFSRAFKYGLKFLKENDIDYMKLAKASKDNEGIKNLLDEELSDKKLHHEAILFIGQSLGSMINLQRDKMVMVGQLPVVKGLFDWVCEKDPDINFGACNIFYGAYYSGRPKALGGDPKKGNEIFLNYIEKNPKNWLARVAYIQFYLIPLSDEKGYKAQRFHLQKYLNFHNEERIWSPLDKNHEDMFTEKNLRIYQTIAMERFKIIKRYQKDIF